MRSPSVRRLSPLLLAAALACACSEPPDKEMHQAQGAIDAARAAGAEEYAPEELKAALAALARSQEAVRQRDYRLALNHALDSREQAQNAAKQAADQKALVRSEAEHALTDVTALLTRANARLRLAGASRPLRPRLVDASTNIARAEGVVQKARAALKAGDYLPARKLLNDAEAEIRAVLTHIGALTIATRPVRRRR